jgi:hypothetical protein
MKPKKLVGRMMVGEHRAAQPTGRQNEWSASTDPSNQLVRSRVNVEKE